MTMAPAQTRTSHQRVQAGAGVPMMVVIGYNSRELCDGQTLASPRRCPVRQSALRDGLNQLRGLRTISRI